MTDHFPRNVTISLIGHAAVVLIIFFRAVMIPNDVIDIRQAIRVDVVDLPKKMAALPEKAAEPAPAPAKPVELPKKAEEVPVKPVAVKPVVKEKPKTNTKDAQKTALSKLKAISALEKIKQEVSKAKSTKPKAEVVAGNKVSEGNSLTGLEKIDYDHYFDDLHQKILSQWNIPQWLAEAELKASVVVLIDERGYVIKRAFKRSSGNDIFDAKVLEAIDSSQPLPPPPQRLRGLLSTSGIVFNFPQ